MDAREANEPWRTGARVTLIHNPGAGDHSRPGYRGLLALMRDAGYQVRYRSSKDGQLASALGESADLVAVAGGDGTIAKVARLMRGNDIPIALLPLGTANNISTALGIARLSLADHVAGWGRGRLAWLDLGRARGPWGSRRFVESVGFGLMPHMMELADDGDGSLKRGRAHASMARACRSAWMALRSLPAFEVDATLDGRELSGRFVVFEAMNIGLVGPNLKFAATADPGDGQFDVVAVREDERELLVDCIRAQQRGAPWPHKFPALRGARLRLKRMRALAHIDDEVSNCGGRSRQRSVDLRVDGRVRIVLPQQRKAHSSRRRS